MGNNVVTEQVVEDFSKKNWADMKGPARALFEHREQWMATAREAQVTPLGTWNLVCRSSPNVRCAIVAATSADGRDTSLHARVRYGSKAISPAFTRLAEFRSCAASSYLPPVILIAFSENSESPDKIVPRRKAHCPFR